jgi:hypothetical protein
MILRLQRNESFKESLSFKPTADTRARQLVTVFEGYHGKFHLFKPEILKPFNKKSIVVWECDYLGVHNFFVQLFRRSEKEPLICGIMSNYILYLKKQLKKYFKADVLILKCHPKIFRVSMYAEGLWLSKRQKIDYAIALSHRNSVVLSVIGGAYASIGKQSRKHAKKAAWLAQEQIRIWSAAGDDHQVTKYRLYLAECYIRLGSIEKAVSITEQVRMSIPAYSDLKQTWLFILDALKNSR